jgi:3',5'-cyclic AMP phosphodiesterase CpdA
MSLKLRTIAAILLLFTFTFPVFARVTKPVVSKVGVSAKFVFSVYGDSRSNAAEHSLVVQEIVGFHPEFVLQTGDLVSDGANRLEWDEFDRITKAFHDNHIAYYPARGNHDLGSYYDKRVTQPFDSGNRYYYAFTRHHNRFIALDEFQDFDPGSPEYSWLEAELSKAQKSATNTFVFFHESPFSVGPHGPTPGAQKYLHPLFVKYHVRAVFCGHDHLYYHTTRDGVTYLVTGGGGAPLYQPDKKSFAIPGDVYVSDYHAIRCEVDGAHVNVLVQTPDGKILDKFTITP